MVDNIADQLMLKVLSTLNEAQARWFVAREAICRGCGGVSRMHELTGLSRTTIVRGMRELSQQQLPGATDSIRQTRGERKRLEEATPAKTTQRPQHGRRPYGKQQYRIRRPGGGRKLIEEKDPAILAALERLLTDETAGDPMTEQRWMRSSLRRLSEMLAHEGHQASSTVISRLLKGMGFSLKANKRKQGRFGCPERDEQFEYIASQKHSFMAAGLPVVSIDTKKKELIGEFRNDGRTWRRQAEEVNEHDFPGVAVCRAVPFGVYDIARNQGYVYVGVSNDTPEFAVHSIARWWKDQGCRVYPKADALLILADSGGSNSCRAQAWKLSLQEKLCDEFGLTVTVCHYPTGCSKWNPIEHRLFSFISKNWEGKPLRSLEIMLGYIRGTSTVTGLEVKTFLDRSVYQRERGVKSEDVGRLRLESHILCPKWNYTLHPRTVPEQRRGDDSSQFSRTSLDLITRPVCGGV
jgi:Rhodopirellula transposase DDE domain